MRNRFYLIIRDLHLYAGLFISPFVLVFAVSVFYVVHAWVPAQSSPLSRKVANLKLLPNVQDLSGRARVDAVRGILDQVGVQGEIGFIRHIPKERRLVVPVSIPGRQTILTIDLATQTATVSERQTGLADALVLLHKVPGPHLVDIRMNWFPMLVSERRVRQPPTRWGAGAPAHPDRATRPPELSAGTRKPASPQAFLKRADW